MYPVVAIVGATGTNKTALAVSVAQRTQAVLLPLDQLHRYRYLKEGTGLDLELLRTVDHFGYQIVSPWEVSGPVRYVDWLREALGPIAASRPVILEGGCTSYLNEILCHASDPILRKIRIIGLDTNPVETVNVEQIRERVSLSKVEAVIEETKILEEMGFLCDAGLQLLTECEQLWKHPEHEDPGVAWAIRISAKIYCPSYLALKGKISLIAARDRIVSNVLDIQRYQNERVRSALPRDAMFAQSQVSGLAERLVTQLAGSGGAPYDGSQKTRLNPFSALLQIGGARTSGLSRKF